MARVRQAKLDSGLGFQVEAFKTFDIVPCSLGSGRRKKSSKAWLRACSACIPEEFEDDYLGLKRREQYRS